MAGSNEELRAYKAVLRHLLEMDAIASGNGAAVLTEVEREAITYFADIAEEGWANCGKCRSPGSCGLTENCFGGHKDNDG